MAVSRSLGLRLMPCQFSNLQTLTVGRNVDLGLLQTDRGGAKVARANIPKRVPQPQHCISTFEKLELDSERCDGFDHVGFVHLVQCFGVCR